MERLFFGSLTGCFLAVLTINTHGILSTQNKAITSHNNNDSGKCFLLSRRECQIIMTAIPSPSPAEGDRSGLPRLTGVTFPEGGRTTATLIEVAND